MKPKLAILTGAGMSAESGFSTFRDKGGLWETYPVEQVARPEAWAANPELVNNFYNGLRRQLVDAALNAGHRLLAEMERDYEMTIITQNVDDLHECAGDRSLLRPFIVWFGEPVPLISQVAAVVSQADVLVIIGTSLAVYPAACTSADCVLVSPIVSWKYLLSTSKMLWANPHRKKREVMSAKGTR